MVELNDSEGAAAVRSALGVREKLSGNRTYYVAADGDNGDDGSSDSPWETLQFAVDWIAENIDTAGYIVTVQLSDGTYSAITNLPQIQGGGRGIVVGNATTPSNVTISGAINTKAGARDWTIRDFKISGPAYNFCITAAFESSLYIAGKIELDFNATNGGGLRVNERAQVQFNTHPADSFAACDLTLWGGNGNSSALVAIGPQSYILAELNSLAISGSPTWLRFLLCGYQSSIVFYPYAAVSGAMTGSKGLVRSLANVECYGAGSSIIPGSTALVQGDYSVFDGASYP